MPKRSKHPGVVWIKPQGEHAAWRVRYRDPDKKALTWKRVEPIAARNAETRTDYAKDLAGRLAKRRLELEQGAPRKTGQGLAEGVERFFKKPPKPLGPRTVAVYRPALDALLAWCAQNNVRSCDDLTRASLVEFRDSLAEMPRLAPVKGGKRGAWRATGERQSKATVNRKLRAVGTVLTYMLKRDLLPRLKRDDLWTGLEKVGQDPLDVHYLKTPEIRALLEAALAHDAQTFRARSIRKRTGIGSTPRYPAIAPAVVCALVTGYRVSHLLALKWSYIDEHAIEPPKSVGSEKKPVGVVDLSISPGLRALLETMRTGAPESGLVFGLKYAAARGALERLVSSYGAPPRATWQAMRRTCGCFLTNAPGVFGAASAYRSAKQLGHSVAVAEKHYVDVVRGIPKDAHTIEAAMGIADLVERVRLAVAAR